MVERPPAARSSIQPHVILAVAALGVFMEFVDSTIVNIAFPSIHRSFHDTTLSTLSWIFNAYSIVFAASLVAAGRLADLFGRRKLFRLGVLLFTIASALCGVAPSSGFLIAMRACQALGGALVVPSSMALVIHAYPPSRRTEAATIYGATAALAAALGPPIGGLLVGISSWRLCFYVNVPIGVLVLVLSSRLLIESRSPGRRLLPDLVGAGMMAAGVALLTLGIVRGNEWGWSNLRIIAAFVLAVAATLGFLWRSSWHSSPVVDPSLRQARPWGAVSTAMLLAGAGFYGYLLCHALFLILVWRYSAFVAGLTFIPGALIAAAVSAASRPISERYGFAAIVVPGAVAWVGGMLWYSQRVGVQPAWVSQWLPGSVITGVGAGLVLPALGAAGIASIPGTGYAIAGALNTTARQIGGALGIALVIVIIGALPTPDSLRHGWLFAAGCFAVVGALGLRIGSLRPREEVTDEDEAPGARPPLTFFEPAPRPEPRVAPPATDDGIGAFLRSVPIFAGLDGDLQERIAQIADTVSLSAGEFLFHRHDPVDGLYVVRAGRIDVILETPEGSTRREAARGAVLGELALLAESRRSASAQARRDCELVRIPHAEFEELLLTVPELGLALTRRLARLLQESRPYSTSRTRLPTTLAVLGVGTDARAFARRLQPLLGVPATTLTIEDDRPGRAHVLDAAERDHDRVLLVAEDGVDAAWRDFCIRQADVVLVAASGAPPQTLPTLSPRDVVIVEEPQEARAWVRAMAPGEGIVTVGAEGAARLARRFTGRAVGLVLSGGGARALAHVGVIGELEHQGVRIDRVAAAGTGALIAGMLASGWSSAEIDSQCFNELVRRRPFSDYRLSRTSLIRGERVARMLERLFGDVWIEELPLQFACVSVDLERGERVVHRSGPLAEAVRAAVTIPGLMAPVLAGDRLLVDAGSVDNLPIDALAAEEGPILVVDVAPREVGPQRVERSRRPRGARAQGAEAPTLAETLARTVVLGSCDAAEAARRQADLSILPDASGVGMLEFHQLDVLSAAGRAAVRDALARQTVLEVDALSPPGSAQARAPRAPAQP